MRDRAFVVLYVVAPAQGIILVRELVPGGKAEVGGAHQFTGLGIRPLGGAAVGVDHHDAIVDNGVRHLYILPGG